MSMKQGENKMGVNCLLPCLYSGEILAVRQSSGVHTRI